MSGATDGFDMTLEVQQYVITWILQAMHCAGSFRHYYARNYKDRFIELQISAPTVQLDPDAYPTMIALVRSRVYYHSRDIGNASDPGENAVVDISAKSVFSLSSGNPGSLGSNVTLNSDWSGSTEDYITVYGASSDFESEVKGAILEFIKDEGGGIFPVPPIGSSGQQVGSGGFRFLDWALVVGLNVGGVKGSLDHLNQVFVSQDFAIAISGAYLLGQIESGLAQNFGGSLPPPYGSAPVEIANYQVCTIDTFLGCVAEATQHVILDSLTVSLTSGSIQVAGSVTIHTDAWYVPDVTADFSVPITLSIAPDQSIQVSVGQPTVQIEQWWGQVANFLSGNDLSQAIANGVQSAVQSGAQGQFSGLMSPSSLSQLASVGSTVQIQITPTANYVEIRSDSIIVHGTINVSNTNSPPITSFVALKMQDTPLGFIFDAGNSWAPGSTVVSYSWDFGDGNMAGSSGTDVQFVTTHVYANWGSYQVCLTVTDAQGRTATVCQMVYAGILVVVHVPIDLPAWHIGNTTEIIYPQFQVLSDGQTVPQVLVTVKGPKSSDIAQYTDYEGIVKLRLNPKDFVNTGPTVKSSNIFSESSVTVTAKKPGYEPIERDLFMVNSKVFNSFINENTKNLERFTKEITDLSKKSLLKPQNHKLTSDSDLQSKISNLALTLEIGSRIVELIRKGSDSSLLVSLLGFDPAKDIEKSLIKRFDDFSTSISTAIDALRSDPKIKETISKRNKPSTETHSKLG